MTALSVPVLYIGDRGSYLGYWHDNDEVYFNVVAPDKFWTVDIDGIGVLRVTADGISRFEGETTYDPGVPPILGFNAILNATGRLDEILSYTLPAHAGIYRISANVNVGAWTTPSSFTLQLAYTADNGVAQVETLPVFRGSTGASEVAITAADRWYALPLFVRAAPKTTIALSTAGSFGSGLGYEVAATIERMGR